MSKEEYTWFGKSLDIHEDRLLEIDTIISGGIENVTEEELDEILTEKQDLENTIFQMKSF